MVDSAIVARVLEIEKFGLRVVDALHDDEIIRVALKKNAGINIKVVNPARWLFDVL